MSIRRVALAMLWVAGSALSLPDTATAEPVTIAAFEPPPPLYLLFWEELTSTGSRKAS